MSRSRRPPRADPFPIVKLTFALIAVILVSVVFAALAPSPQPDPGPVFGEESCEVVEPRYAVAVGLDPGGLWLWTASGERRIDCRAVANCTGAESYDWQELQRRLALARGWHPDLGSALLLVDGVDLDLTLVAAQSIQSDSARGGAELFPEVALGGESCRPDVQSMLVEPAPGAQRR